MNSFTPRYLSDISVDVIQQVGGDHTFVAAARVSTSAAAALDCLSLPAQESEGLIRYLMQHRHGSPFEHSLLTVFVHAPICVWREWHRHRIASYNEESGRYKTLEPVFYIPARDRPMVKVENWKPGRPKFLSVDEAYSPEVAGAIYDGLCNNLKKSYELSYQKYLDNLAMNIDPGLARDCLPVGIYSSCWVSFNPRAIMNFLSLRTHRPEKANKVSYPLWEIEMAANKVEKLFAKHWPITYKAFNDFGREAP